MKTFADIAIPVFAAIEIAAMAGAFAITCRRMRRAARHRRRSCARVLAAYERDFKHGRYAREPRYDRRQP